MSELKAVHAFDVYEAYTKTGDDDAAQVYIKSEADREIRRLKRTLWLARAKIAHLEEKLFVYDMAVDDVTTEQLHNAEIMANKWYHIKRLCINKAEEYK